MPDDKDKLSESLQSEFARMQDLETGLDQAFGSLQPPYGADQRLMSALQEAQAFQESDLTLDKELAGPYSFEQAAAQQQAHQDSDTDLLAAGLEEGPVEPIESIDQEAQTDDADGDKDTHGD